MWNIVERIASWVRRSNSAGSQQGEERGDEEESEVEIKLFHCVGCDVTYISRKMELCSSCGCTVEPIPNERELDRSHRH